MIVSRFPFSFCAIFQLNFRDHLDDVTMVMRSAAVRSAIFKLPTISEQKISLTWLACGLLEGQKDFLPVSCKAVSTSCRYILSKTFKLLVLNVNWDNHLRVKSKVWARQDLNAPL